MAKAITTNRLIIKPALDDSDKTEEILSRIIAADEFEFYFGTCNSETNRKNFTVNQSGFYNIFDRENNLVGYVGVHREEPDYEVEIYIFAQYRRRGFATETLSAIIGAAFSGKIEAITEDFEKIVSSVRKENLPSRAMMEKFGFVKGEEPTVFFIDTNQKFVNLKLVNYCITRERFSQLGTKFTDYA